MLDGSTLSLPVKRKKALVVDLFCGAGGTDRGAKIALERLGYRMELVAVNHNEHAIASNKANFPDARHHIADVNAAKPWLLVPEGRLDLLMASPECVHHSRARGGKPTSDQERMDPWAIVTWISQLRVKRLLIENVPEFVSWGPIDARTGKPIKSRKGEYFRAWLAALAAHGFVTDHRILNCADYGDPTTRQRFFLIGRSDGKPLTWPQPTHAPATKARMLGLKPWPTARDNVIDWSLSGASIFSRKKPLARATLARIEAGARKFRWPEPFLVILRRHMDGKSIDEPVPTVAAGGQHIGLAQPYVFPLNQSEERQRGARSVEEPLCTVTASGTDLGIVEPFLATVAHGNEATEADPSTRRARSLDDPLQTIHAGGGKFALVQPFILNRHGENGAIHRAHDLGEPLPTADCRGAGYLVEPRGPWRCEACGRRFSDAYAASPPGGLAPPECPQCGEEEKIALPEPFMLSRHAEGAPRSVEQPTPTQVAKHSHILIEPLIAPYYGDGSGKTCKGAGAPLDTVTAKARFGLVMPVTHGGDASNRARDLEAPLPTITTAKRGELAFITAAFGEREGQAPRVHSIEEPAPTVCAQGRVNLVEAAGYDILFRMLQPHELARAMSLGDHVFLGTKEQKTRQIGNAVPAATAAALVGALMGGTR